MGMLGGGGGGGGRLERERRVIMLFTKFRCMFPTHLPSIS